MSAPSLSSRREFTCSTLCGFGVAFLTQLSALCSQAGPNAVSQSEDLIGKMLAECRLARDHALSAKPLADSARKAISEMIAQSHRHADFPRLMRIASRQFLISDRKKFNNDIPATDLERAQEVDIGDGIKMGDARELQYLPRCNCRAVRITPAC